MKVAGHEAISYLNMPHGYLNNDVEKMQVGPQAMAIIGSVKLCAGLKENSQIPRGRAKNFDEVPPLHHDIQTPKRLWQFGPGGRLKKSICWLRLAVPSPVSGSVALLKSQLPDKIRCLLRGSASQNLTPFPPPNVLRPILTRLEPPGSPHQTSTTAPLRF